MPWRRCRLLFTQTPKSDRCSRGAAKSKLGPAFAIARQQAENRASYTCVLVELFALNTFFLPQERAHSRSSRGQRLFGWALGMSACLACQCQQQWKTSVCILARMPAASCVLCGGKKTRNGIEHGMIAQPAPPLGRKPSNNRAASQRNRFPTESL